MSNKVDDMAYTAYVALTLVDVKGLWKVVHACGVLGGVVCDSIAKRLSKVKMKENFSKL
jgi:hypothetical protein